MHELPIEIEILDCLVDAPSSFAALFGEIERRRGRAKIADLMDAVQQLETLGLIKAGILNDENRLHAMTQEDFAFGQQRYSKWLPQADYSELSGDEIGLWIELSKAGREKWRVWAGSQSDPK